MKKRVLSLLLVLMLVVSLVPMNVLAWHDETDVPYAVTGGNIYFDKSTGTITDCDSEVTEANIPAEIDGVKVTSIGQDAFRGCPSLTNVMIPNSVTSIGSYALEGCTSLTSINVAEDNEVYSSTDGVLFNKENTSLILYPFGKTNISYEIPNSVTSIYDCAFRDCTNLANITILDSVVNIGDGAFSGCKSLISITIPKSVTSIGSYVFEGCTSLTSINVAEDNEVYSSADGVLFNKGKTSLILYPFGKTNISYEIPNSVTYICDYAFSDCPGLMELCVPNTVTHIGCFAIIRCISLTSINVEENSPFYSSVNGVLLNKDKTEIIRYPEGKTETSYAIPNSVTRIGEWAFAGCVSLTSIEIPNSVTYINGGFDGCTGLTSITIPNSVTGITGFAFSGCTGLTSIKIPDSVTTISECAFGSCTGLTSITIPDSVTYIGGGVFQACTGLTSITIPNSVTHIGGATFFGCQSLTDVYYTGTEEQWNAIEIADGNDGLLNATIHYNYHEHVTELRNAVEPSCTEAGYTGDEVCTICGETIKKGEVIEATGHHFKGNTCPDCGATRSTADTIRAFFQTSFNNFRSFFDKLFGR